MSGEAARKTSGAERFDLLCWMELDLVSNLSIKPTSPMQRTNLQKHPDSGCLRISGVVIGSALSKGSRSGPEAFRAGHFADSKPETALKSLSHPGYDVKRSKKQIQCFVRKKTTQMAKCRARFSFARGVYFISRSNLRGLLYLWKRNN